MTPKKNVKLGNDVIQNIDNVQLEDADHPGEYVTFSTDNGGSSVQTELTVVPIVNHILTAEDVTNNNQMEVIINAD